MVAQGRIPLNAARNVLCPTGAKTGRVHCSRGVGYMIPEGPFSKVSHLIHGSLGSPESTTQTAFAQNGCNISK